MPIDKITVEKDITTNLIEDKVAVAKELIKLTPFKLSFAAKSIFGDESSNSLTKIANRMKGNIVMTEAEADRLIQAHRELAQSILSLTHFSTL